MRTIICIPTYNERDNLASLLDEILQTVDADILVVDDDSPDGTGQIAELLSRKHPRLRVVHRAQREGLGRAYLEAFQRALADGYEIIVQMDADFSHQPRYLPAMLQALDRADVVIGSRFTESGRVENWGVVRRLVSRASNWYASGMLSVPYHDSTSGFVAFRRHVLEALDLASVLSEGYAFQVELKYRAYQLGFTVEEIPIRFWDRIAGSSKLPKRSVAEAALRVAKMRWKGPR